MEYVLCGRVRIKVEGGPGCLGIGRRGNTDLVSAVDRKLQDEVRDEELRLVEVAAGDVG